jgi:hypothetical protein
MTYYVNDRKFYVDFHYLLGITQLKRSHLHGILKSEKIRRITYKNTYLYRLEDLSQSAILSKFLDVDVLDLDIGEGKR